MSIAPGAIIDEHNPLIIIITTGGGADGGNGASSGANIFQSAADQSLQANELVGKIGATVIEYNAETDNRLIQEY